MITQKKFPKRDRGSFKGKKALVVGLARSGVAAANLLSALGCRVKGTDSRGIDALGADIDLLDKSVALEIGRHDEGSFTWADIVVLSPGVPKNLPQLFEAERLGKEIISEVELAYSLIDTPFLAVTGTNGKTTTVSLVAAMLEKAGFRVVLAGNIGRPLCLFALGQPEADFIVAEISSFQLETIATFRPHVAAVLNVTPDHLDRHASFEEYLRLKKKIALNMGPADHLVLNGEDRALAGCDFETAARKIYFGLSEGRSRGAFVRDEEIVLRLSEGREETICRLDELPMVGVHNIENTLAASLVARLCGAEMRGIAEAVRSFRALPHRLELVREVGGVKFYNDSKATNVGATQKALQSFDCPVVLIAGGRDKDGDFRELAPLVEKKVRALVAVGEAARKVTEQLGGCCKMEVAWTFEDAVMRARRASFAGDAVLLSPACASFDMFINYEERGNRFKEIVMGF